jgi:uncharacterized radical SAM superfamily Fe-S cluster-containing enzyme
MNYNKIKLYWKTLLFRRGITIALVLTYKCNLDCLYCILKVPKGIYPSSDISTLDEWKEFIRRFPVKIKEVYLSGGEPTLYPDFVELTNWLLDEGYHVKVFSNLLNINNLLKVQRSYRFIITSTFHWSSDYDIFMRNYWIIRMRHRVDVHELKYKVLPIKTLVMSLVDNPNEVGGYNFTITPDRKIYIGCYDAVYDKS